MMDEGGCASSCSDKFKKAVRHALCGHDSHSKAGEAGEAAGEAGHKKAGDKEGSAAVKETAALEKAADAAFAAYSKKCKVETHDHSHGKDDGHDHDRLRREGHLQSVTPSPRPSLPKADACDATHTCVRKVQQPANV